MKTRAPERDRRRGFGLADLLAVLAVILIVAAVIVPILRRTREQARQQQCTANLAQVGRALLTQAEEHQGTFLNLTNAPAPGGWWYYKEEIKGNLNLSGPSSPADKVFACPSDRGYGEPTPFWSSPRYDYTSYVYNGVNLPGIPNIAALPVAAIKEPARTLLVMEWTAHAPLSWHQSRTGDANAPFYNDARSVVTFVDGHVGFIPIYYDGVNAAFTRDPIGGYDYKYSGN